MPDLPAVLDDLERAQAAVAHLEGLDRECREATADAERQTAGMREVALFRAANAKAVMGNFALSLARRNVELIAELRKRDAALRAVQDVLDEQYLLDERGVVVVPTAPLRAALTAHLAPATPPAQEDTP